ncbi:VanZ family protein [Pseudonocardia kunmingensis]|uniref:Glycopeptide antibiotics resistance protein n=1 Tax=Pseudonocardia kunmingensis TaxID=630975 RepID=A0A543D9Y5_9PSEU|nr:VanZ family protein [Pseudonocardia kunmingensis]TQM06132.1 glycopeptide antibiotics resistance protein [Pseudonocardia kunmingensis]
MGDRIVPAVIAVFLGVALAGVLLVPYVAVVYRRRGELGPGRALIAFAALVYGLALVAYVLLPLPQVDAAFCARHLALAVPQLDPLRFLADIRAEQVGAGPRAVLANPAVQQVVFNVALFVPLGAFVRYLGRRSVVVAALVGVAVSVLVELTQYTGNWFLYPCAYRIADVDDLIANGLGALVGAIAAPLLAVVPGQRARAPHAGQPRPVTGARRLLGVVCDLVAVQLLGALVGVPLNAVLVFGAGVAVNGSARPEWVVALQQGLTFWLPAVVLLVLPPLVGAGGTAGQRAVLLRPALGDGHPPGRGRRLARTLAGTGGFVLCQLAGGALAGLAALWGAASLVALFTTRDHRGLGGVVTRTTVVDVRVDEAAAQSQSSPPPVR